jgi:hypothetical protein
MIGCMFSGKHALPLGKDEHFFIDRDGRNFYHILNFLRSPEGYKVGLEGREKDELRRECEYYGIDQLMFAIPCTGTEKDLICYSCRGGPKYPITALVDPDGVYTWKPKIINDNGKIEYCPSCHSGYCLKGCEKLIVPRFNEHFKGGVVPAAQPRVQGTFYCGMSAT